MGERRGGVERVGDGEKMRSPWSQGQTFRFYSKFCERPLVESGVRRLCRRVT